MISFLFFFIQCLQLTVGFSSLHFVWSRITQSLACKLAPHRAEVEGTFYMGCCFVCVLTDPVQSFIQEIPRMPNSESSDEAGIMVVEVVVRCPSVTTMITAVLS